MDAVNIKSNKADCWPAVCGDKRFLAACVAIDTGSVSACCLAAERPQYYPIAVHCTYLKTLN